MVQRPSTPARHCTWDGLASAGGQSRRRAGQLWALDGAQVATGPRLCPPQIRKETAIETSRDEKLER